MNFVLPKGRVACISWRSVGESWSKRQESVGATALQRSRSAAITAESGSPVTVWKNVKQSPHVFS